MQSSMLKAIVEDFGNGGTIDGDLVVSGDLTVSGGGSLSFDEIIEGTQVIDVTSTEALLVRKNGDGGDVFVVDTTNEQVKVGDNFIVNASGTTPVLTITGTRNDILFTESDTTNLNTLVRHQTGLLRIDTINDALDTSQIRFTIDHSNGNVSIGSAEDSSKFLQFKRGGSGSGVVRGSIGTNNSKLTFIGGSGTSSHMTLDSSGNFGINKTSPEEKLHVAGNVKLFESGNTADKTYSSTGAGLFLTSYQSDSGSPYTKTSDIVAGSDGTVPSELRFFTRTSGSSSLTNALTIDSNQNVSIGSSGSGYRLDVRGTGSTFFSQTTATSGSMARLRANNGSTSVLQINADGNIGIGTESPNVQNHIFGGSASQENILLKVQSNAVTNDGSLSTSILLANSTGLDSTHGAKIQAIRTGSGTDDLVFHTFNSSLAEAMRLGSDKSATFSGNVILSKTTNSAIYQDDSSEFLRLGVGGSGNDTPRIEIFGKDYGGSNAGGNIYIVSGGDGSATSGDILLGADQGAFAEHMRITNSGDIGIGVSPTGKLDINISSNARGYFSSTIGEVGSGNFALQAVDSGGSTLKPLGFRAEDIRFATGSALRMVLDDNSRISLSNNDSGTSNTLFGKTAGDSDGAGDFNVFVGELSGGTGTQTDDADGNVGVGYRALTDVTSGNQNVAIGKDALTNITSGDSNIGIGSDALGIATTAEDVVVIGRNAGYAINNDSADGTIAIGRNALTALTSGEKNTAIGFESAKSVLQGNRNTALGYQALDALAGDDGNNGGSDNIAIGVDAMGSLNAGVHNDARANSNIAIGNSAFLAGSMADSGASVSQGNVAIGHEAIMSTGVTPQTGLVAVGFRALKALTSGVRNTAVGFQAMDELTVGEDNVALGYGALGGASTSSENKRNIAIGASAMSGTNAGASQNTAIGYASLDGNLTSTADNNTAFGYEALGAVTSGRQNVAVGSASGDAITAGVQNVIVGADSDISAVDSGNEVVLGYGVTGVGANQVSLGNTSISAINAQVTSITAYSSDERTKKNVEDYDLKGVDFIKELNLKTYIYKNPVDYPDEIRHSKWDEKDEDGKSKYERPDDPTETQVGLIAQEVIEALEKHNVGNTETYAPTQDSGIKTLTYGNLIFPLIKAVQELSARVEELEGK